MFWKAHCLELCAHRIHTFFGNRFFYLSSRAKLRKHQLLGPPLPVSAGASPAIYKKSKSKTRSGHVGRCSQRALGAFFCRPKSDCIGRNFGNTWYFLLSWIVGFRKCTITFAYLSNLSKSEQKHPHMQWNWDLGNASSQLSIAFRGFWQTPDVENTQPWREIVPLPIYCTRRTFLTKEITVSSMFEKVDPTLSPFLEAPRPRNRARIGCCRSVHPKNFWWMFGKVPALIDSGRLMICTHLTFAVGCE